MTSVTIPCPQCGAALKLPDRTMLGRKGKCPKCGHRFVLAEPDDIPLELAEPERPASAVSSDEPLPGKAARWIPDNPELSAPAAGVSATRPPAKPPERSQPAAASRSTLPSAAVAQTERTGESGFLPEFAPVNSSEDTSALARVRSRRKRRNPSGLMLYGAMAAVVAGIAIGVFLIRGNTSAPVQRSQPQPSPEWDAAQKNLNESNQIAEALIPTNGDRIPLELIPFTPQLLLHLRPAELWQRDRQLNEFQATLGVLSLWLAEKIETLSTFAPAEIEEFTLAVNFGARGSEPDVAAVVRLQQAQQRADLFRRFKGNLRTDLTEEVIEAGSLSYLIADDRTFAVAPAALAGELADARRFPALLPAELESLATESDRTRHLTLLVDLQTLDVHRQYALIESLQDVADRFLVWTGAGTNAVSWSLHLKPHLYMETLFHPTGESTPLKLQRDLELRLSRLPEQMTTAVRRMQPLTEGARRMIGRFPAMLKAMQLGTSIHVDPQFVRLVTILPAKAAANLGAAGLLTWNQSLNTNFSEPAAAVASTTDIPEKIVERLKLPVLIDFRNFPLQEAVGYIGEVIRTEIVIDGDALKAAGFTQNMNQTFNLGTVPAVQALDAILKQYAGERDPMIISIDEANNRIILGTRSKAELDGIPIFDTSQPQ